MEFSKTYSLNGKEIKISTGKIATLAQGSVFLQMGGTTLFAATTIAKEDTEQDFFPLSIEYIEKMYARGAISGSRFQKREGIPSDEAIVKARQVDHSIRSLFPKSFKKPTAVVLTVLSYDQVNDPEVLAVMGASLSLMLTGMPFYGPCSSTVACVDENGEIVNNPDVEVREKFQAEFLISGVDDKPLNIEGWAKELPEEKMNEVLDKSNEVIKQMNQIQREFVKEAVQTKVTTFEEEYDDLPAPEVLINKVKEEKYDEIKSGLYVSEKIDRNENLTKIKKSVTELIENKTWFPENSDTTKFTTMEISLAVEYIARKILREGILKEGKRVSGRGLTEVRPLSAEIDVLPTVHGSALFNRGLTQSLSIVALGALRQQQMIDDMEGETSKRFMHHYNMPSYATGEAGRYNYHPGRREIGHGAIGENALRNMIPTEEDFPYTIRVVSEIMTSNGSTSMAATCASSMALMTAGVPMKAAVAGIGVGLITEAGNEDNYKLILDIEGIEDFYGDMDFKITGTTKGITAIQYENKLRGVKLPVLKETFKLSRDGRLQVLEVMNKVIAESRPQVSENAPVVEALTISQENIGGLIGPGGKNIKEIIQQADQYARYSADINIDDSGRVLITAGNRKQMDFIKNIIATMFEEPEVGKVYTGVVDKIMPYGMFINVSSSISGLLHVSEISDKRIEGDLGKLFHQGDEIKVKISKYEDGRTNFTTKNVEQTPEVQTKIDEAATLPPMPRESSFSDRGGTGGRKFGNDRGGDRRRRF